MGRTRRRVRLGSNRRLLKDAFVVIVNGDGERLFGVVLSDALQVELALDLRRFGNAGARFMLACLRGQFFIEDLLAENNAIIADVNARPGDQLFDFGV